MSSVSFPVREVALVIGPVCHMAASYLNSAVESNNYNSSNWLPLLTTLCHIVLITRALSHLILMIILSHKPYCYRRL